MTFTLEQDVFLIKSYFRNGQKQEDGRWIYSMIQCVREFEKQYPDTHYSYDTLSQHIRRLVKRFRERGTILKLKSTGRKTVLTDEVVEDIRYILEQDPKQTLRQLSQQIGLSAATCRKVVKFGSTKPKNKFGDLS